MGEALLRFEQKQVGVKYRTEFFTRILRRPDKTPTIYTRKQYREKKCVGKNIDKNLKTSDFSKLESELKIIEKE